MIVAKSVQMDMTELRIYWSIDKICNQWFLSTLGFYVIIIELLKMHTNIRSCIWNAIDKAIMKGTAVCYIY